MKFTKKGFGAKLKTKTYGGATTVITIQGIIEYLNLGMFNAAVLQDHLIIPELGMSLRWKENKKCNTLDTLD